MSARSWTMVERVAWVGIVGLVLGLVWYVTQGLSQPTALVATTPVATVSPTATSNIPLVQTVIAETYSYVTPVPGCISYDQPTTITVSAPSWVAYSSTAMLVGLLRAGKRDLLPWNYMRNAQQVAVTDPQYAIYVDVLGFEPGTYPIVLQEHVERFNILVCPR